MTSGPLGEEAQRRRSKRTRIENTENPSDDSLNNSTDTSIIDDAVSVYDSETDGEVPVQFEEGRGDMELETQSQDEEEEDVPAWMTDDSVDDNNDIGSVDEDEDDDQLILECRDGVKVTEGGSGSWEWEKDLGHHKSHDIPLFPNPNYSQYRKMSPRKLFGLFLNDEFLQIVADKSNEYGVSKTGKNPNIDVEDLTVFIGVLLLSGYNSVKNFEFYWSQSEDLGNELVKKAITRDRFRDIKRSLHFGNANEDRPPPPRGQGDQVSTHFISWLSSVLHFALYFPGKY